MQSPSHTRGQRSGCQREPGSRIAAITQQLRRKSESEDPLDQSPRKSTSRFEVRQQPSSEKTPSPLKLGRSCRLKDDKASLSLAEKYKSPKGKLLSQVLKTDISTNKLIRSASDASRPSVPAWRKPADSEKSSSLDRSVSDGATGMSNQTIHPPSRARPPRHDPDERLPSVQNIAQIFGSVKKGPAQKECGSPRGSLTSDEKPSGLLRTTKPSLPTKPKDLPLNKPSDWKSKETRKNENEAKPPVMKVRDSPHTKHKAVTPGVVSKPAVHTKTDRFGSLTRKGKKGRPTLPRKPPRNELESDTKSTCSVVETKNTDKKNTASGESRCLSDITKKSNSLDTSKSSSFISSRLEQFSGNSSQLSKCDEPKTSCSLPKTLLGTKPGAYDDVKINITHGDTSSKKDQEKSGQVVVIHPTRSATKQRRHRSLDDYEDVVVKQMHDDNDDDGSEGQSLPAESPDSLAKGRVKGLKDDYDDVVVTIVHADAVGDGNATGGTVVAPVKRKEKRAHRDDYEDVTVTVVNGDVLHDESDSHDDENKGGQYIHVAPSGNAAKPILCEYHKDYKNMAVSLMHDTHKDQANPGQYIHVAPSSTIARSALKTVLSMLHVKIDESKTGPPTKPPRRYVEEYVDVTIQNNKTVCKVDRCTRVSECKRGFTGKSVTKRSRLRHYQDDYEDVSVTVTHGDADTKIDRGFTGKSVTKRSRLRRYQDDYEDVSVTVTHGDADTKVDRDGGRIRLPSNKTGSLGRRNRISSNRTSKGSAKKLKKASKQPITPDSNNASDSSSDSWETDSESDGYSVISSGHFYRKKSPAESSANSTQPALLPRRPSAPTEGATSVTSRLPPRPPVGPISPGGSGDQNLVRKGQRGAPTSKVMRPSCPPPLPPSKKTERSCDLSASSPTGSPTKLKHARSDTKLSQAEPPLNIDFKRPLPLPPTSQSMSPKDSSSEPTLTPLSRSSSSASDWSQSSRSDILVPSHKIGVLPAGKLGLVRDKSPLLPPRNKILDTDSVMEQKSDKLKAELKSVEIKESKPLSGLSRGTPSRKTRDATKNWVFGTQSDVPPEPVLPREPKSKWNTKDDTVKRKPSNCDAPRLPPRPKTQICLADRTEECVYSEVVEPSSERPQRPPRPKSMAANVNLLTVPEKPPRISVCKASDSLDEQLKSSCRHQTGFKKCLSRANLPAPPPTPPQSNPASPKWSLFDDSEFENDYLSMSSGLAESLSLINKAHNALVPSSELQFTDSEGSSGISDSYMDPFTELASQPTTSHLTVDDPDTDDSEDFCQVYRKGSRFEDEPLYQMYHKGCIMRDMIRGDDADLPEEEEIYIDTSGSSSSGYSSVQTQSSITKDTLAGTLKGIRSLWRELPEVQQSGVIPSMSDQELKCKEALFEIVTSEASYVKSLDLAHDHFMMSDELRHLKKRDRQILFSNIEAVRETSSKLLAALEEELTENILLSFKICDIIKEFAMKHFNVYVIYCRNQTYQHRKMKELVASNPEFVANVRHLESDPRCQSLNLMSFLLLPMQRITRLPLLIDAVISRLDMTDDGYPQATTTLQEVNKVVRQCNEGAKQMANMEEVADIMNKLVYKDIKTFPLVSRARYLVKRGMLTHIQRETLGGILPRRAQNLHFYLFNDLLVITKKKSENQYIVVDYTARIHVEAQYLIRDSPSKGQSPGSTKDQKNLFLMVLLENHAGKAVEYLLSTKNTSEMTRWVEAVTPPQQVNENEKIYEDWDCPQVQVVSPYTATQPDELSLEESDIINVFRKLNDGMYEGERIRDGQRGWFPASHTKEIHSKHIRAKNLRQRYRLLMLSESKVAERQFQTSKFFF